MQFIFRSLSVPLTLPACRRLLFPFLHVEKGRLHAGNHKVSVNFSAKEASAKFRSVRLTGHVAGSESFIHLEKAQFRNQKRN